MTISPLLLPQTVTITPYEGSGGTGPTFGDPFDVRARIDGERKLVLNASGSEVVADKSLIIEPREVRVQSRVTLPGETSFRTVIASAEHVGAHRAFYVELNVS